MTGGRVSCMPKGGLTNLHECEPFDRRIACLAAESDSIVGELSPSQTRGPAMFYLMRNPTILDILESLIGPEILCHPTHVVRPRMRNNFNTTENWRTTDQVPWHQDAGVLRPEADNSLLITVWIPLSEANEENGCLMVIPGSHKYGVRLPSTNQYLQDTGGGVAAGRTENAANQTGWTDSLQQLGVPFQLAPRLGSGSLEH